MRIVFGCGLPRRQNECQAIEIKGLWKAYISSPTRRDLHHRMKIGYVYRHVQCLPYCFSLILNCIAPEGSEKGKSVFRAMRVVFSTKDRMILLSRNLFWKLKLQMK